MSVTRRQLVQAAGALVISFALPAKVFGQGRNDARLADVDAWLAISSDGAVTAYCGKVELGTGIQTAFTQLIAEELDVPMRQVSLVMGDTQLCPDQGPTVGSASLFRGGPQVRQAAAEARYALLAMASVRLGAPAERLIVKDGTVVAPDDSKVTYAELVGNKKLNRKIEGSVSAKAASKLSIVGRSEPRVELPAKVFGHHPYVHNLRLAGMLHGRVVRAPRPGAKVASIDESSVRSLEGVRVLRKGGFVGVVAEREEGAIAAARQLSVTWQPSASLPPISQLSALIRSAPLGDDQVIASEGDVDAALASARAVHRAQYFVPHQMHASIGPSCAVADVRSDRATLWSPTQSSFITRNSIAAMLEMAPDKVRLIWTEGSGCYGHNGADDCTADAALLSQLAGKPVRVQWMRHDEHGNEPVGAAMVMAVRGALDEKGNVSAWDYEVWSPSHNGRPASNGARLLAGEQLGIQASSFSVGADRNAQSSYVFAHSRTRLHQLAASPSLRVSSLRGLGSPQNTFANESFMDELAALAHADPIEFRIRHLKDQRAIAVLEAVASLSKWERRASPKRTPDLDGRGVGFVHYDNYSTYVAVVVRVAIDRRTGKVRVPYVAVAHDCGLIVNPDGVKNQIEGNVIQAMSRALLEEVKFDRNGVTSLDWGGYPILSFSDVPQEIAITLLNRPDQPMVGAGEGATSPVSAAIANAIFDATGKRLRTIPFTPERVLSALA